MSDLERFVRARLDERDLPETVLRAYTAILEFSGGLRAEGETEDWVSWLTGDPAGLKLGEYLLGADPVSEAERAADHLRAVLARTWSDHPDYDPAWDKLANGPKKPD